MRVIIDPKTKTILATDVNENITLNGMMGLMICDAEECPMCEGRGFILVEEKISAKNTSAT